MRRLVTILALLPLLLLSACGSGSGDADGVADAEATAGAAALDAVTVTGEVGQKPTVEFATPFELTEAAHTVISEGDGEPVAEGQQVTAQLVTLDGGTGEEVESSYDRPSPVGFPMDSQQINPALFDAVAGVPVGSRVLVGVPPQSEGSTAAVVVIDILGAEVLPTRAEGTPVEPAPGLPTVTLAEDGAPTITLPDGPPPTELVTQQLITGTGPAVEQGQTITVHYTGVKWPGGEVFDSSWEKGSPASFPIGVGQVIPGWDAGLVGQPVGSQVLLVVPPAQGYGEQGQPDAGITGTDTLVFVVDILDAT